MCREGPLSPYEGWQPTRLPHPCPALRPGAIAQSPGREAALAWATSMVSRFPASQTVCDPRLSEKKLWDVWRGLILALTLILNLGAGIWLGLGKWGVSAAQEPLP